ncbi:MAG: hypothetical protein OXQ31_26550 [Spirochaetaceae bacterium]|nr:hypothetical protein [Spirochaetaceae bacterium]
MNYLDGAIGEAMRISRQIAAANPHRAVATAARQALDAMNAANAAHRQAFQQIASDLRPTAIPHITFPVTVEGGHDSTPPPAQPPALEPESEAKTEPPPAVDADLLRWGCTQLAQCRDMDAFQAIQGWFLRNGLA